MSAEVSNVVSVTRQGGSRLRSFFAKVLLTFLGVIVALLLLELLLQLYNPLQVRIKGNRIVLTTNKTYHIKNDIIKALPPEITVTRNSLGFRGPNPPSDLGSHLSLVSIGGSTTQNFFLSDDQTWTARLGEELKRSFSPVWVNNAGLDGHSTHGHQVLLEDFVVPLRPKVALFLVGANDVARGTIAEWDAENVKSGLQVGSIKAFIKSLSAYSEVAALVLTMYRSYTAHKAGLIDQQIDFKQQGYLDIPEEEQNKYLAEHANSAYLNDYQARLKKIVETCRNAGIKPVLVTQPLLVGFGTDDVTGLDLARIKAYGPRQSGKMYWDVVETYNGVVRNVGRENDVQIIDLAKQMPKSSRYFYDFIHYTPEGAQVIAEIIARSLCPELQRRFPQNATQACPASK
jgi:lysophospholipase L1-like esterase